MGRRRATKFDIDRRWSAEDAEHAALETGLDLLAAPRPACPMYMTCTYRTLRSGETSSATLPGVVLINIDSSRISESLVASSGTAMMPGFM